MSRCIRNFSKILCNYKTIERFISKLLAVRCLHSQYISVCSKILSVISYMLCLNMLQNCKTIHDLSSLNVLVYCYIILMPNSGDVQRFPDDDIKARCLYWKWQTLSFCSTACPFIAAPRWQKTPKLFFVIMLSHYCLITLGSIIELYVTDESENHMTKTIVAKKLSFVYLSFNLTSQFHGYFFGNRREDWKRAKLLNKLVSAGARTEWMTTLSTSTRWRFLSLHISLLVIAKM